jgi:carbon monoxide dehydrogenase subunit G
MKIEGTHELRASRERIFQALLDPAVLQRCIPGCEQLEPTGENSFAATLRAGVGTIKGLFKSTVRIEDVREPEHYKLVVEGKGQPGFVKGAGTLDLEARGDELTVIKYEGDVQVGGMIASVGQRMILGAARMLAVQFFTTLEAEARTEGSEPPPPAQSFFRNALRSLSGLLRRLFRPHPPPQS